MKKQKIAITGGLGFIGSSLIEFLNKKNISQIDIFEIESCFDKWENIKNLKYSNIFTEAFDLLKKIKEYDVIIHLGAHSQTNLICNKENYENNVEYTKELIINKKTNAKFIFASSASVYGNRSDNELLETVYDLNPQSFYAFTKLECDKFIEKLNNPNVYSLRFFNVYGAKEKHKFKNNMCSPIYRWIKQDVTIENPITILENKNFKLERDFIHVEDICKIIYHCMQINKSGGIYNAGTGVSFKWQEIAEKICELKNIDFSKINFKPFEIDKFPGYQTYTKASLNNLRNKLKYNDLFLNINEGIEKVFNDLKQN